MKSVMKRVMGIGLLSLATLGSTGCRMCCPSYDYCMPTRPQESNSECCGMQRQGSAFNGVAYESGEYIEEGTVIEADAPMPMARASRGTPTPAPSIPRVSRSAARPQR